MVAPFMVASPLCVAEDRICPQGWACIYDGRACIGDRTSPVAASGGTSPDSCRRRSARTCRGEEPDEEPSEVEIVEDLESILDDCLSARLPWLPLNWHYRSRHESLIAFSNHHCYRNRLLTFPSPYRESIGISWLYVPGGVYDRGKSATNRAEADAIVAEIVHRLLDE